VTFCDFAVVHYCSYSLTCTLSYWQLLHSYATTLFSIPFSACEHPSPASADLSTTLQTSPASTLPSQLKECNSPSNYVYSLQMLIDRYCNEAQWLNHMTARHSISVLHSTLHNQSSYKQVAGTGKWHTWFLFSFLDIRWYRNHWCCTGCFFYYKPKDCLKCSSHDPMYRSNLSH